MEYAGASRFRSFRATIGIRNPGFAVFFFAVAVLIAGPAFSSTVPIDCNTSPFGQELTPLNDLEIYVGGVDTGARGHAWIFDGPGYGERFDDGRGEAQTADTGWSDVDFDVVSIDLDGDGRKDSVAAYRNTFNPNYGSVLRLQALRANGSAFADGTDWGVWASNVAIASGRLLRRANEQEDLAVAWLDGQTGRLNLILSGGQFSSGSWNYLLNGFDAWARWLTGPLPGRTPISEFQSPRNLSIDVGDLDGDGFDDEIVTAFFEAGGSYVRLGIFEYDPGVTDPETAATGAGSFNLRDQVLINVSVPNPNAHVLVKVGDISGGERLMRVVAANVTGTQTNTYLATTSAGGLKHVVVPPSPGGETVVIYDFPSGATPRSVRWTGYAQSASSVSRYEVALWDYVNARWDGVGTISDDPASTVASTRDFKVVLGQHVPVDGSSPVRIRFRSGGGQQIATDELVAVSSETRRDEIVILTDSYNVGSSLPANGWQFQAFEVDLDTPPGGPGCLANLSPSNDICVKAKGSRNLTGRGSYTMDMDLGDTDGDGREEIVVGWGDAQTHVEIFEGETLMGSDVFAPRLSFVDLPNATNPIVLSDAARHVSVAVGGVENKGKEFIFAAYRKSPSQTALDAIRLQESTVGTLDPVPVLKYFPVPDNVDGDPQQLIPLPGFRRPRIALGDVDDDALQAVLSTRCSRVSDYSVTEIVSAPPRWSRLGQAVAAEIGQTSGSSQANGQSITRSVSHANTLSLGISAGIGVGLAELGSTLTTSLERAYTQGATRSSEQLNGTQLTVGVTSTSDLVLYEKTTYECFEYGFFKGTTAIPDATSRACELPDEPNRIESLYGSPDDWDGLALGPNPEVGRSYWIPLARPWANLTQASLSSTPVSASMGPSDAGTAGRVIDGLTDATSPRTDTTGSSPTPWIQVDLGTVQAIETVRVWNRTDALNRNLDDFSVFVSEADPSSISDDPTVLGADPAVFAQRFQAGVDGYVAGYPVTTALTLENGQPKQGRYVRVQLHDRGGSRSLGLLEIQVFGPDQVEPPRYPSRVEKVDADHFRVEVFDRSLGTSGAWKSLTIAGELLWAPTSAQVGFPLIGNATGLTVDWNLQNYTEDIGFVGTTTETSTSVGLELEIEASLLGSGLSLAGGQSISNGITRESVRTTTTSDGLLMGGFVDNLPSQASSVCRYQILPYYYVTEVVSDYGFKHELRVLDYLVSDEAPYLTRVDQDYGPCLRPDPEIAVEEIGAGIRIADGASASSASNGTDFGPTLVGESLARTFRITNLSAAANLVLGPAPVVSIDQAGGSAWAVALQPATTTLAPGASTQFRIEFTPSAEGSFPATVHVASNDGVGAADFDFAIGAQTVPLAVDTDLDGLTNGQELALGTDWQNPDTDGDGISDGDEVAAGTSPLDPRDPPPPPFSLRLDVDASNAPAGETQEGFARMTDPAMTGDALNGSFSPTATVGGVTVTVTGGGDFRDRGVPPNAQTVPNLMRDLVQRNAGVGSEMLIRIQGLPAGEYAVTSYHIDGCCWSVPNAFDLVVDDGLGTGRLVVAGRRLSSSTYYGGVSYAVTSNGADDVLIHIVQQNTANGIRFNGIEIVTHPEFQGHAYELVASGPTTFEAAREIAQTKTYLGVPGNLVAVTSAAEDQFIIGRFDVNSPPTDGPWLGLACRSDSDCSQRGNHRWVTGEPFSYDGFAAGEPNGDCNAFVDRECGSGYFDVYAGAWNDFGADGLQQILVEYPLSDPARSFSGAQLLSAPGMRFPAVAPLQDGTRLDFPAAPGALLFDLPMTAPGAFAPGEDFSVRLIATLGRPQTDNDPQLLITDGDRTKVVGVEISNDGSAVVSLHGDIAGDAISNLQSVGSVSGCSCYPAVGSGFVQVEMVLTQVGGVLRATGKMTGSNSADELPFEFAFPVGFDASTGFDLVMGNAGQDYEVVRVAHAVPEPQLLVAIAAAGLWLAGLWLAGLRRASSR